MKDITIAFIIMFLLGLILGGILNEANTYNECNTLGETRSTLWNNGIICRGKK